MFPPVSRLFVFSNSKMKDQWNVRNQLQLLSIIGERKMAESKGSLIAKSVQKHAGRAKEKILQNLGKVDRTADEIFDDHLHNFTRQQNAANRLQKEFNNYIRCIRAVQTASKTLMESLNEIYESQWPGHDVLFVQSQNIEMLWQDFSHKLGDQVLVPLNTYQSQFPETKKKIDKRGRKLVDFDSQRHNFQSLQSNPRKKDDVKVQKAKEALEEAKRTYEVLNSELHDELPALYESRVLFLVTNLQTFFAAEQVFHSEIAKVYNELEAIADKLANDAQRGPTSMSIKKSPQSNASNFVNNKVITNAQSSQNAGSAGGDIPPSSNSPSSSPTANASPRPTTLNLNNGIVNGTGGKSLSSPVLSTVATTTTTSTTSTVSSTTPTSLATNKIVEELYDIPLGANTDNLPPGVLYRVKATYRYNREDSDELSFEVGEIIRVVEYDDPEEQEEGWLMGIKEGTGEKGMFPANFTRPI